MDNTLKEIKAIQSTFLALKDGVEKGSELLINFVNSKEKVIEISDEDTASIVSLVMLDSIIKEEVNYSLLQDFDFKKDNLICKKFSNKKKCLENIKFLLDFLHYRIEFPIDIAVC